MTNTKIAALKAAMLAQSAELAATDEDISNSLREVAEDDGLLRRFAELLAEHETPAAALDALTPERDGPHAADDVSGRHIRDVSDQPWFAERDPFQAPRERGSIPQSHRGEGNNFVD